MTLRNLRIRAKPGPTGPDVTPPTPPTSVSAVWDGTNVTVTWSGATDDVGVVTYVVSRNGNRINYSTTSPYVDHVTVGGSYVYTIEAIDAVGHISDPSDGAVVTVVPPDTTPPSVPTGVLAQWDSSTQKVTIKWNPSTGAPVTYIVYRDGQPIAFSLSPYLDPIATTGTYVYTIASVDQPGNVSAQSAGSSVDVLATDPVDTTPPSVPSGVAASWDGAHINLTWNPSTGGAVTYIITMNGNPINFDTASPYQDTRGPGSYTYKIQSVDAAGNVSAYSSTVTVIVPGGFTPTVPADGKTEVTAALQNFFDYLPPGTALNPTIVNLPRNAVYWTDGTIQPHKDHLIVHGNNAQLVQKAKSTSSRQHGGIYLYNRTDMKFDHLTVVGSQPNPIWNGPNDNATGHNYNGTYNPSYSDQQHGWIVYDCVDVELDNANAKNVWGDFWYWGGGAFNDNCNLTNSLGSISGRQGLTVNSATNCLMTNLTIDRPARHIIDLESNGGDAGCDTVTISYVKGTGGRLGWIASSGSSSIDNSNITIDHHTLTNQFLGLVCHGGGTLHRTNWVVTNCTGSSQDWNGETLSNQNIDFSTTGCVMDFNLVDGVHVHNNHQSVRPSPPGKIMWLVNATFCTGLDVSGNSGNNLAGELYP